MFSKTDRLFLGLTSLGLDVSSLDLSPNRSSFDLEWSLNLILCLVMVWVSMGLVLPWYWSGLQRSSAFQSSSGITVRVFVGFCDRPGAFSVCSSRVKSVMSGMIYSLLQDQCSVECDPHALR